MLGRACSWGPPAIFVARAAPDFQSRNVHGVTKEEQLDGDVYGHGGRG